LPYAVWLEMTAPEPINDVAAAAQLPGLIADLLETGWEEQDTAAVTDDDDTEADSADGPGLLDMRVRGYRDGALIGLAVDTDVLDIATTIGASLGRHLADAAPALLGWTTESLRAVKLTGPDSEGDWLPPRRDDGPHFPVAEHLRHDLLLAATTDRFRCESSSGREDPACSPTSRAVTRSGGDVPDLGSLVWSGHRGGGLGE
jgi:hypothetical protein